MNSVLNPYAPRSGCPLCSIASTPYANMHLSAPPLSPRSPPPTSISSTQPQIVYKDTNVTAYIEKNHPVSSKGHIIIVLNLHVPSIYHLSSTDLPLLIHIQQLASRLLRESNSLPIPRPSSPAPPTSPAPGSFFASAPLDPPAAATDFRIGFITPPFRDPKIPVTDHVHCHAFIGPPDLAGWWRGVAYSSLGWYAIDDLIAEIRESTSNNRIKSAYPNRPLAPIDMVPTAGVRSGGADGQEDTPLPLPLQANKIMHLSPSPSPRPPSSDEAVSTARAPRPRKPQSSIGLGMMSAAADTMEDLQDARSGNVKGSIDLGSGYQSVLNRSPSSSSKPELRVVTRQDSLNDDVNQKWRPVSMSSDADGDAPEGFMNRQPSPSPSTKRVVSRSNTLSPPTVV